MSIINNHKILPLPLLLQKMKQITEQLKIKYDNRLWNRLAQLKFIFNKNGNSYRSILGYPLYLQYKQLIDSILQKRPEIIRTFK